MSEKTKYRKPGDPLSPDVVRGFRDQLGLTQEELAERMGLSSKTVISGWETGRAKCEGPSAELLLRIVGRDASQLSAELENLAESVWRRSGTWSDTWRQISAVPEFAVDLERDAFVKLFPDAALPPDDHVHGFPFVSHGLPPNVFGVGSSGWIGSIPVERERMPRYTWQLTRELSFAYREVPWEISWNSIVTSGYTHIGSLLEITGATTHFLKRLAERAGLKPSTQFELSLDLEGMLGRGIVAAGDGLGSVIGLGRTSPENHVHASISRSIKEISTNPMPVAFSLVGELALLLRPDLTDTATLTRELQARVKQDRNNPKMRFLGFADAFVGR